MKDVVSKTPPPSYFAPNLICFAFVRKQFPFESRRIFELQHRLALMRGVKELVEHHGCDLPSDGFEKSTRNGFMDAGLTDSLGNPVTLEATGSDRVKTQKIVQACLYRSSDSADSSGRVWVSAINEIVECPPRLIRMINTIAPELHEFMRKYPELTSHLFMAHSDVCPQCDNASCPHWKQFNSQFQPQKSFGEEGMLSYRDK